MCASLQDPGTNTLELNLVVSRGIWQHASWVPNAETRDEASSEGSVIAHLHRVGMVGLVVARYACGVSLWKPGEVPDLVVVVTSMIGTSTAAFCFYCICCRAMSSSLGSNLSAAWPSPFFHSLLKVTWLRSKNRPSSISFP